MRYDYACGCSAIIRFQKHGDILVTYAGFEPIRNRSVPLLFNHIEPGRESFPAGLFGEASKLTA